MTAVRLPDGNRTAVIDFITVFFLMSTTRRTYGKGRVSIELV